MPGILLPHACPVGDGVAMPPRTSKYTKAETAAEFVEFLRGLSEDAEYYAKEHGRDQVNMSTPAFLRAAAEYIETVDQLGGSGEWPRDPWQNMVGILSIALIFPPGDTDRAEC
ncbi:hypothetical protein [Yinghuangia sp. YIM S10712]|uniref:hypothetical protein n=1 Tax=Yinghuangia sp. YIM S10712 TaxID=3436930 RepID=UPI003F53AAD6